jgi:hypothetical protein
VSDELVFGKISIALLQTLFGAIDAAEATSYAA